jgi:hypothetical protein
MALNSPGVQITVSDESFFVPSDTGTTPLVVVATSQDKTNSAGTGTATGTTSANAGKVTLVSSQRELTSTFGDPTFYKDSGGTPIDGYELNEYGLLAAHSFLGIANRAYVLRAGINLSELVATATEPTKAPTNGTYWLDLATSKWGIFEWDSVDQEFDSKTPTLITSTSDLVGSVSTGAPKTSIGSIGDYAINTTNVQNKLYYKNDGNAWVEVGSNAWKISHPTIKGTVTSSSATLTNGNVININGVDVTLSGTTLANLATSINNASITGVTAAVDSVTGYLEIYGNGLGDGSGDSTADDKVKLANTSGTILTDAGLTAGTYNIPKLYMQKHTSVPQVKTGAGDVRPSGSVWVKTSTPDLGMNVIVKLYSTTTQSFSSVVAPAYADNKAAIYNLDSTGGTALAAGQLYVQVGSSEQDDNDTTPPTADYRVFRYQGGVTQVDLTTVNPMFTVGDKFTISETLKTSNSWNTKTITIASSDGSTAADSDDFITSVTAAGLTNVTVEKITSGAYTGALRFKHTLGGEIRLQNILNTPLNDAGITTSTANEYGAALTTSGIVGNLYYRTADDDQSTSNRTFVMSNWKRLSYEASTSSPTAEPTDGTYWYSSVVDEVDIMEHDGTTWKGRLNISANSTCDPEGPIVSATEPTKQSDGTALVLNDIWVDTSDLENYPRIYRYESTTDGNDWVLIDNTDQTSEKGILFADARQNVVADRTDSASAGGTGGFGTIKELLSDDMLDPDAPDPALYPQGMLLFNTRRSGYGVRQYKNNYITTDKYPGSGSSGKGNTRRSNESVASYYPDRWVSVAGNKSTGAPYMGRKAQRKVIVDSLKSAIASSTAIREEQRQFNVIACPGYPELIADMTSLNADRGDKAFVVGDTPFRLADDSTSLTTYFNNTAGVGDNGEDGFVTSDDQLGVFYPSGQTTDLGGNTVVVPASHMVMRTIAVNDSVGFPWFAPAGTRRGIIDNASNVGYIKASTGEFQTLAIGEGTRDTLQGLNVNPLTFINGVGLVNFGNKTKASSSSSVDRINVARLIAFLRTEMEKIARPFVFEPNDSLTRNELKQAIESFLLEIVGKRGLYDFLVVCDETNNTATRIDRNELYVDIAVEPVKSVEFIFIPIRIKNTGEIAALN